MLKSNKDKTMAWILKQKIQTKTTTGIVVAASLMVAVSIVAIFVAGGMMAIFAGLGLAEKNMKIKISLGEEGARAHPYLFFNEAEMAVMRAEAFTTGNARNTLYNLFRAEIQKTFPPVATNYQFGCTEGAMPTYGLMYQIVKSSDPEYADALASKCKVTLMSMATQGGDWGRDLLLGDRLVAYALAYDWFYDYLERFPNDLPVIRDRLARETNRMWRAIAGPRDTGPMDNWWYDAYSQNHYTRNVLGLVFGANALRFEGNDLTDYTASDVQTWTSDARDAVCRVMSIIGQISDGSMYEGGMYNENILSVDVPNALVILNRLDGVDWITNQPLWKNLTKFYLYDSVLSDPRTRVLPAGDLGAGTARKNAYLNTLRLVARAYGDGLAQWTADLISENYPTTHYRLNSIPYTLLNVMGFIYYDRSVQEQSPEVLHPSWRAADLEAVFMRSGWDEENHFIGALKVGAYGGHTIFDNANPNGDVRGVVDEACGSGRNHNLVISHAHHDNNNFSLIYNGKYLAVEAPGYWSGSHPYNGGLYGKDAKLHNTVVVDGLDQIGVSDDYGSGEDNERQVVDFWVSDGKIELYQQSKNIDYTIGDATRAYQRSLGLTKFYRHMIFVKPGLFIILDELNSASSHSYDWYLHVPNVLDPNDLPRVIEPRDLPWVLSKGTEFQTEDQAEYHYLGTYLVLSEVQLASPKEQSVTVASNECLSYEDEGNREYSSLCRSFSNITGRGAPYTIPYMKWQKTGAANTRFLSLFFPFDTLNDYDTKRPAITKLSRESEDEIFTALEVLYPDGKKVTFALRYGASGVISFGNYTTDGQLAIIQKQGSEITNLYLSGGTYLKEGVRERVSNISSESVFEAEFSGRELIISGENFESFKIYAPRSTDMSFYQVDEENKIQTTGNVPIFRQGDYIIHNLKSSFRRGDANGDGILNMSDSIFMLDYLFKSGATPDCLDAADTDDSGVINITDAANLLNYLFSPDGEAHPAPLPPFEQCGIDPTLADELSCVSFLPCE